MRILWVALATAQLVSAAVDLDSETLKPLKRTAFIVELNADTHLKRGFALPHEELYHDLDRRDVSWHVKSEYHSDVMTGVAIQLSNPEDLVKLAQVNGVQSITPIYHQTLSRPEIINILTNATTLPIGGPFSPHEMTGVKEAHDAGYLGEGITVAIIDDGIDYTNPYLGGKLGPDAKVSGGYDFVGDNYVWDSSPPVEDDDPFANCKGHGTHIAGIVAADPGNSYNISGVAYKAKLRAYRISGCPPNSGTTDDIIISVFIRAYEDGNDIIKVDAIQSHRA